MHYSELSGLISIHTSTINDMKQTDFDKHFEAFMKTFRLVIDKYAPIVKAPRK